MGKVGDYLSRKYFDRSRAGKNQSGTHCPRDETSENFYRGQSLTSSNVLVSVVKVSVCLVIWSFAEVLEETATYRLVACATIFESLSLAFWIKSGFANLLVLNHFVKV